MYIFKLWEHVIKQMCVCVCVCVCECVVNNKDYSNVSKPLDVFSFYQNGE